MESTKGGGLIDLSPEGLTTTEQSRLDELRRESITAMSVLHYEEYVSLLRAGATRLLELTSEDFRESHAISETINPGLPIMGKHLGAVCVRCGDYIREPDREAQDKTAYKGCERCRPTQAQRARKGFADNLIKDNMIFNGEAHE